MVSTQKYIRHFLFSITSFAVSDPETFGAELSLLDLLRPAGMPSSLRSLSLDESVIVSVREDNVSEEDGVE